MDKCNMFLPCSGTLFSGSGVPFYLSDYEREPPKTNCLRCGAPMSKYAEDCEYCGKKQKD